MIFVTWIFPPPGWAVHSLGGGLRQGGEGERASAAQVSARAARTAMGGRGSELSPRWAADYQQPPQAVISPRSGP